MRAGVVIVPLDLRMAPGVVRRICATADTPWIAVGGGQDAPDLAAAGVAHLNARTVASLTADPAHESAAESAGLGDEGGLDAHFPADWEEQLAGWPRPRHDDLFEIVFTSGTTGRPNGAMLSHGNVLATLEACTRIIPPWQHRLVSLLPLSHLFGQLELILALFVGAELLYLRSRNPRVIFGALREQRVTTMIVVPQLLELFWNGLLREVAGRGREKQFRRARAIAHRLPYGVRRFIFREIHQRLGGELRLFVSSAAFLPPSVQESWQDLGIVVMQGYGATECGFATAQSVRDHRPGRVGRAMPPSQVKLAQDDGEVLVSGPNVFAGYWRDPEATAAALGDDRWYRTGDVGSFDGRGELVLTGRKKNMIVLPNGLNVFPEDIEKELREQGLRGVVVVETAPGRIEAVALTEPDPPPRPPAGSAEGGAVVRESEERRNEVRTAVANANRELGIHQRVVGIRFWPEPDFPRTHTLKIRRDLITLWASKEDYAAADP